MISAVVIDVANFYVHKRHLQLQADAAALAGAQSYVVGNCSDAKVVASTRAYGGSASDGNTVITASYNDQIGGTNHNKMYLLINSAGYRGDSGTYGNNTDPNGSPCTAKYVDVKLTETDLPWFFGFGGIVRRINAHARVGLVQVGQTNGTLPIAVPNPLPTSAAAIFIDETTGPPTVVGAVKLSHVGIANQLDMWSNGASPKQITIPSRATGVVIALSGRAPADLAIADNMTLSAMCQQSLTDCYDGGADPPTNGVSFIRGYSGVGSGTQPNAPILRSVELFPGNCPNIAYFSANTSTCNFELVARIDAGTNLPKANQIYTAGGVALDSSTDPNCAFVAGADQCWHGNLAL